MINEAQRVLLKLVDCKNERIDYEGPTDTVKGIQLAIDCVAEYMHKKGE